MFFSLFGVLLVTAALLLVVGIVGKLLFSDPID